MASIGSKVFIEVEGGLVVGVYVSDPDVSVTVINHDDLESLSDEDLAAHEASVAELSRCYAKGSVKEI